MTEDDVQKILHRAAELQGFKSETAVGFPDDQRERLGFVARAAEEVGIARSDFDLATAEVTGSPSQKPVAPVTAQRSRQWLAHPERVYSYEATVASSPDQVLAALQAVLAEGDFQVDIANMVGDDPQVDGVLVLEPADLLQLSLGKVTKFRYAMATADFRQVLVTVRPSAEGTTVLRFHVNLDHAAALSYGWGLGSSLGLGVLVGLGVGALTLATGPLGALGLGGLAGVGTFQGLKVGWRVLYRWSLDQGRQALVDLAARVGRALKLRRG